MSSSGLPKLESLIDRLYREAVDYAQMYKLPDSFVWYVVGAGSHMQGIASSQIDELLDYWRGSYSKERERLDKSDEGA